MFAWSDRSALNQWKGEPAGVGAAEGNTRIVTVNPLPVQAAGMHNVHEQGRTFVRDHRGIQPPLPQKRPQAMEDRGYYRTFCTSCPFKRYHEYRKGAEPEDDLRCRVFRAGNESAV